MLWVVCASPVAVSVAIPVVIEPATGAVVAVGVPVTPLTVGVATVEGETLEAGEGVIESVGDAGAFRPPPHAAESSPTAPTANPSRRLEPILAPPGTADCSARTPPAIRQDGVGSIRLDA
jgi:hypothetical protein